MSAGYVYVIDCGNGWFKVGRAKPVRLAARLRYARRAYDARAEFRHALASDSIERDERAIHLALARYRNRSITETHFDPIAARRGKELFRLTPRALAALGSVGEIDRGGMDLLLSAIGEAVKADLGAPR